MPMAAVLMAAALTIALPARPLHAHRLRPAVVSLEIVDKTSFTIGIVLNLEAVLAGIGPQHRDTNESPRAQQYDALRRLSPTELVARMRESEKPYLAGVRVTFDGARAPLRLMTIEVSEMGNLALERLTTLRLAGPIPAGARSLRWRYAQAFGSNVLRIGPAGRPPVRSVWLTAGTTSEPIPMGRELLPRSRAEVARNYLELGFVHIVPRGLDHILFVLGIFLLSLRWGPLLSQVTAFTIAHSITLGLSIYGLVSLPASVVEPLIAMSIVYVAVENILTHKLKPWRVAVVFGFGLIHGLGFAGVLQGLGLPRSEFLTALITFNVGVELGQLTVISAAFLAVGLWFRHRRWYRSGIVIPGSVAISVIGAWWTVERIIL